MWNHFSRKSTETAFSHRPLNAKIHMSFRQKYNALRMKTKSSKNVLWPSILFHPHYDDVIMIAMASQITSLTIVYSTVYLSTDERKYQSSASLAFVRGVHRWPVNSPQRTSNAENVSIWWHHRATWPNSSQSSHSSAQRGALRVWTNHNIHCQPATTIHNLCVLGVRCQ